ncbi:MAG: hypothetical protein IJX18_03775, partial [Clostridia bacterium]|nr:hypothetical protein [Clostridia bacterium]
MERREGLQRVIAPLRRMFWGEDKSLLGRLQTEKPLPQSKILFKRFLRIKSAVVALVFLAALFAFVFIAPIFFPMDVNATDGLQQNVAPNYDMLSLPKELSTKVRSVDGFSGFTVGLDRGGKVYVWGAGKDGLTKKNLKEIPDEIESNRVEFLAAGKDHAIAILQDGKVVGWGDDACGQYGENFSFPALTMPTYLPIGQIRSLA